MLEVRRGIVLIVLALLTLARSAAAQEIFLVRHAERADQTPQSALSAEGRMRAQRLAAMLVGWGITQIYTTDLKRAIDTAVPLAEAAHVANTPLPAGDVDDLVRRLRAAGPADRVLVVGHSNTIPAILSALGVPGRIDIGEAEYGNLFIVVPRPGSAPQFVRLEY